MQKKIGIITSFYKGERYLDYYFGGLIKIDSPELFEVIFVHNVATEKELSVISQYKSKLHLTFKHIIIAELESIYASWNRAVLSSDCCYYTIWNVDDYRDYNSIARQIKTLDDYPEIGVTYGNQINITKLGKRNGLLIQAPEFSKSLFLRGCLVGAFVMWRRSLMLKHGLFDEQFKSGGDFEYWVRFVANGVIMKKTSGIAGYFLNENRGASTDGSGIQPLERTVIELRYGIFDKINYKYLARARKYDIDHLYFYSSKFDIRNFLDSYDKLINKRKHLWLKSVLSNFLLFLFYMFLKMRILLNIFVPVKLRKLVKSILIKQSTLMTLRFLI